LQPAVYRLHEQADQTRDQPSGIVVRTAVEPASINSAVRQAIWSIDKNQPIARIQTIEAIVNRQLSVPSQNTALLSTFALLALFLASIGLYGMMSFSVRQRTREVAVRLALGAQRGEIVRLFLREGLRLTSKGLVLGLAGGLGVAKVLGSLLIDVTLIDPIAFAVISALLTVVALLATYLPARQAMKVDPMTALRHD